MFLVAGQEMDNVQAIFLDMDGTILQEITKYQMKLLRLLKNYVKLDIKYLSQQVVLLMKLKFNT